MTFPCASRSRFLCLMTFILAGVSFGFAGVSRVIQEQYKTDYENKSMYLKIPIYLEKQIVTISGQNFQLGPVAGTPKFKVGDQIRILQLDFASDEIKLKLGGITTINTAEIAFKFDSSLLENFPNRDVFDRALQAILTEGIKYTEIDDAKRAFVERQFDRSIRDLADSASLSRDSALKSIAPLIPAYQDALRDIENLKDKVQDISGQLSQSQSENRKRESELKALQTELSRLKSTHASLQEKADSSAAQVVKLGAELRDAKTAAQGYQKELADIQRTLNLKADANLDLSQQITDLGQALKKLQKENEAQLAQVRSLQAGLETQKEANARLTGDNEELKTSNRKMQATIDTLSKNKDSIQNRFVQLKKEKETLDDFVQSLGILRTRIVEEKTESGIYSGTANVFLNSVLLGSLSWNIPAYLNFKEEKSAEATFTAESIDYVKTNTEEKHFLRLLGDRLKVVLNMSSDSDSMTVSPEKEEPHEIGEREHYTWRWTIGNRGTQDSRIVLTAHLINKNSHEIPLFQQERILLASNAVRQVRNYLQPVSLAIGAIIGFLIFGIVGIFRRRKPPQVPPRPSAGKTEPVYYEKKKQL
jgi:predicted nuclease with TOPRIM domain